MSLQAFHTWAVCSQSACVQTHTDTANREEAKGLMYSAGETQYKIVRTPSPRENILARCCARWNSDSIDNVHCCRPVPRTATRIVAVLAHSHRRTDLRTDAALAGWWEVSRWRLRERVHRPHTVLWICSLSDVSSSDVFLSAVLPAQFC